MTAQILNLRKARKAKARNADVVKAAENRAKFGQLKQARDLHAAHEKREAIRLDGHKRERPEETET